MPVVIAIPHDILEAEFVANRSEKQAAYEAKRRAWVAQIRAEVAEHKAERQAEQEAASCEPASVHAT